jgi:LysM repeat protein
MSIKQRLRLFMVFAGLVAATFTIEAVPVAERFNGVIFLQPDKNVTHTVAKGETAYSIARLYGISVTDLYAANPKAAEGVKEGEKLTIPQNGTQTTQTKSYSTQVKTYTVKAKETLYTIAKENGVRVDDIIAENPDLKTKPLLEGQILRIPVKTAGTATTQAATTTTVSSKGHFIEHKVQAKETLYSIGKLYNISTEAIIDFNPSLKNGGVLKEGMTLIIPVLENSSQATQSTLLDNTSKPNIGIVLPFVNKSDGQSARFVEYYEGFLMALADMKAKGFSANVYAFDMGSDTGTDKLSSLLDTYEMKYLDLIVGGVSQEQVRTITSFAQKQGVKYVVPFPTRSDEVTGNSQVFQVNAPRTVLLPNVASTFVNLFGKANVIYITENGKAGDRADLVAELNKQLPLAGIIASSVDTGSGLKTSLSAMLDSSRKNVIVPTSTSTQMLKTLFPVLKTIKDSQPNISLSLFGHSDWQTYTSYFDEYADYDAYIYTPFYLNNDDARTIQFMANYKKWYNNKQLINTYPKYAVLGYDTGMAFLTALWQYGKDFANNPNSLAISTLQMPFLFKRSSSQSGYMNNGFYIVHYKPDGSVEKREYGR